MNRQAFTLIELLAVVVIIAIIATIGVFSITRIINESRFKSLEKTAYAVKKAAKLYATENPLEEPTKTLNMTPQNGEYKSLIELSKDPWGKEYDYVAALLTKQPDDSITVDVFINTNEAWYITGDSIAVSSEGNVEASANPATELAQVSNFTPAAATSLGLEVPNSDGPFFTFNGVAQTSYRIFDYEVGTWVLDPNLIKIVPDPKSQKGNVGWIDISATNFWEPLVSTNNDQDLIEGTTYKVEFDYLINQYSVVSGTYPEHPDPDYDYDVYMKANNLAGTINNVYTVDSNETMVGTWQHAEFTFVASANAKANLQFEVYLHRLYLDNIKLYAL